MYYKIRTPRKLKLGQDYIISWPSGKNMNCKLIQPTNKGYNFLNIDTHKCIMNNHMYPDKNYLNKKYANIKMFWVNKRLSINY
jgi:hypothetical protein